jgi:hypothetical protein
MSIMTKTKFRLYAVAVHLRSLKNGEFLDSNPWEEVIFLVRAEHSSHARSKASSLAHARSCEYTAPSGERWKWEFFQVAAVHEIEEAGLADGGELFSRHLQFSEARSLVTPFDH